MNRFAKATFPVGPAGRDGDEESRHIHRAAACLQTKARPPSWIHTPQTQAGPQPHAAQVSATLRAKGISKEMIAPKPGGVLASKGIGKQTFQLLHSRTSQEPSSSTPLRPLTPTTGSSPRATSSALIPYHVSHQQQIRADAMKKHPRDSASSTSAEHELQTCRASWTTKVSRIRSGQGVRRSTGS